MTQEATPAVPSAPDLDAIRAEAAILERSRVSAINTLCETHKVTELRAQLVEGGVTLDAARSAILDAVADWFVIRKPPSSMKTASGR